MSAKDAAPSGWSAPGGQNAEMLPHPARRVRIECAEIDDLDTALSTIDGMKKAADEHETRAGNFGKRSCSACRLAHTAAGARVSPMDAARSVYFHASTRRVGTPVDANAAIASARRLSSQARPAPGRLSRVSGEILLEQIRLERLFDRQRRHASSRMRSYPPASSSSAKSAPPDLTMRPFASTCTRSGTMWDSRR